MNHVLSFAGAGVLITGAAGIYGREFAKAFGGVGAHLVLTDRDRSAIEVSHPGAASVSTFSCDLTDAGAIDAVCREIIAACGVPDVVIGNAGIYPFGGVFDTSVEVFDQVFDINVRANFLLTRHLAEAMIAKGTKGNFIFVGSAAAHVLRTNGLAYCASKRAMHWMMQGLAVELAPHGIRVNMIEPGFATGGAGGPMPAGYAEAILSQIPLGRLIEEGEAAAAALFLASPSAAFTTGMSLSVDGGGAIPRRLKVS